MATFKQRGQKIMSRHCFVYRLTDQQLQNSMPPLFPKGGGHNENKQQEPFQSVLYVLYVLNTVREKAHRF